MGFLASPADGRFRVFKCVSMLCVLCVFGTPAAAGGYSSWQNAVQINDNMRLYQQQKHQQAMCNQYPDQCPQRNRSDTEVMDYHFTFGRNTYDGTQLERAKHVLLDTDEIGPFLRGKGLYVRWRVKSTGKVYEDAVNLESLLPSADKNDSSYLPDGFTISFKVKGPQLYVYLHVNDGETRQIYPVSTK